MTSFFSPNSHDFFGHKLKSFFLQLFFTIVQIFAFVWNRSQSVEKNFGHIAENFWNVMKFRIFFPGNAKKKKKIIQVFLHFFFISLNHTSFLWKIHRMDHMELHIEANYQQFVCRDATSKASNQITTGPETYSINLKDEFLGILPFFLSPRSLHSSLPPSLFSFSLSPPSHAPKGASVLDTKCNQILANI